MFVDDVGALNLAQALSNRPSKGAKEKLVEARVEAKELSEVKDYQITHTPPFMLFKGPL